MMWMLAGLEETARCRGTSREWSVMGSQLVLLFVAAESHKSNLGIRIALQLSQSDKNIQEHIVEVFVRIRHFFSHIILVVRAYTSFIILHFTSTWSTFWLTLIEFRIPSDPELILCQVKIPRDPTEVPANFQDIKSSDK